MPRWITVREPYDHYWPSRAVTAFPPGEHFVKDEVADAAVGRGKATEGKADGSEARSVKGKRKATGRRKAAKTAPDADTADNRPADRVDQPNDADDGRPTGGGAVDAPAG